MKQLPKIEPEQVTPFALTLVAVGFCLMQSEALQNLGAILFSLGLLPLAVMLAKYKD